MNPNSLSLSPHPLTEIRLYGHLRRRFGKRYRLSVRSAGEAVRALCTVVPGFRAYLAQHSAPGYRVVIADSPVATGDELHHPCGRLIRIVPAVAGAKRGFGQIFLGAALIGLSFVLPIAPLIGTMSWSSIALNLGVSMALGGISQMLAGSPPSAAGPAERPNNQPSYAFNGAVNTTAQGNAVPVGYGRMRIGSQVISTGLSVAAL